MVRRLPRSRFTRRNPRSSPEDAVSLHRKASRPPGSGQRFASLDLHVVLDGGHALDAACQLDRPVRRGARAHEATQLNLALEGLDLDLQGLRQGVFDQGGLHLGGDDGVVDVLAGSLLCACRCASDNGSQGNSQKNCGKILVEMFHGGTPKGWMEWSLRVSKAK